MNIFYDKDCNPEALRGKKLAVIGYGSQGFAQSNNLRESGCEVTVGLRRDSLSVAKAAESGLRVLPVAQAAAEADIVMMLVPDELAPDVYARDVAESMTPGKYLAFSHGFSVHYGFIKPPADEGTGPSGASRIQTRGGGAVFARRPTGSHRRHSPDWFGLRFSDWRRTGRSDRN
jgi:ketol-acid reductoisomerase